MGETAQLDSSMDVIKEATGREQERDVQLFLASLRGGLEIPSAVWCLAMP